MPRYIYAKAAIFESLKRDMFQKNIFFGWWFQILFYFQSLIEEMIHFGSYFGDGLVQPPTSFGI